MSTSFKIIIKREIFYELELFNIMRIHSIFHSWLLRKNSQNSLLEQINESSNSIVLEDNLKWEMNEILNFKTKERIKRLQYKVKWANWSHDRVWYYVDDDQFNNVVDVVNEYHKLQSFKSKSLQSNSISFN